MPPFSIGADEWPGAAKVLEEAGELTQVLGKLMAYPDSPHPDGSDHLGERLTDELGDVLAAIDYFIHANRLGLEPERRRIKKRGRFWEWHRKERSR